MNRELRDELEVPGYVNMIQVKTKADWISQARKAMEDTEAYGATKPNEMRDKERDALREAMEALGVKCDF